MTPQRVAQRARRNSLGAAVTTALLLLVSLPLLATGAAAFAPTDIDAEPAVSSPDALVPLGLGLTSSDALAQGFPDPEGGAPATPAFGLTVPTTRAANGLSAVVFPSSPWDDELVASATRLDLQGPSFRVQARFADMGSRLGPARGSIGAAAPEEVTDPAGGKGGRNADLAIGWGIGESLSLTTSRRTRRVDDPSDERYGLNSSQLTHALQLQFSGSTQVKASMTQEREQWDARVGGPVQEKSERRIELTAGLGGSHDNALSAAVCSLSSVQDGRETVQQKTEAHLKLVPTARLRLQADYLDSREGDGRGEATTTLGATLSLGPQTQLSAHLKGRSGAEGPGGETGLALSTALGGGRLTSEHKQTRGEAGSQTWSKHTFASAFGGGPSQTNVSASLEQTRSEEVGGAGGGQSSFHVDRWLSPRLQFAGDWKATQAGTAAEPTEESAASCRAQLKEFGGGELGVTIAREGDVTEADRRRLELAFSRRWRELSLRLARASRAEPGRHSLSTAAYVDLRTGDLPTWATDGASPFEDAEKYLVRASPIWGVLDMPFAGYRLWTVLREGGQGSEPATFGFAHRRIIADRYQLQALLEEHPEALEGSEKGRAQPLRRSFLEVGAPVRAGLHARLGCGIDESLGDGGGKLTRLGFGVWGVSGPLARLQADVSHESGRWEGAEKSRTSVSLLYARRVSDEDRIEVKLGYAWGTDAGSGSVRDCRLALSYEKPV